ncbi:hypothetical protein [Hymenobacter sp. BT491]|uniref:hypothetical protein n=1 Tax=Hymenobacter sp. BT491 TaxID=2766779 RepID=UPI001653785A|nr:hypothetical protein [Hymenobacter sp. BT491]MBC6988455.1 hypothetical protein [Hymenobacter sp. BT491]
MATLSSVYTAFPDVYDEHGQLIAVLRYYPADYLLHVLWKGNLTGNEVIRVAETAIPLQQQFPFQLVLDDKTEATGDWSDAFPFIEFEWLPQAMQQGLRAFAYVFSPEYHDQLTSFDFLESLTSHNLAVETFYNIDTAWEWLQKHHVHA